MGLDVGVSVKKQPEQYMLEGHHQKDTGQEIEADFNTLLELSREVILSVMGVPPAMIGLTESGSISIALLSRLR